MGKIRSFFDNLFYGILEGINKAIANSLKEDPKIEKAKEDFDEANENMKEALSDLGENPQKYIDDFKKD